MEKEIGNYVECCFKKSSSKDGNLGYDVVVRCDGSKTQKEMEDIATIAFNVAKNTNIACQGVVR